LLLGQLSDSCCFLQYAMFVQSGLKKVKTVCY
jgi:hypothetical protein